MVNKGKTFPRGASPPGSIRGNAPMISSPLYSDSACLFSISSQLIKPYRSLIKNTTGTIKFTADGVSYETSVKINALMYAELLLTDNSATDIEKDAVLKLIAYVEEAYEYVYVPTTDADGNEIAFADSNNGLKFSTFFTDYNGGERPTYITDYSNETVYDIDETFESTVEATMSFGIHSNSRMTFFVTLSAESVAAGYTVKLTGTSSFSGTITNDDGSVTYYTNNAKLVNSIMASKYVITVYDSSGAAVASTNYNLATYCAAVNCDLMNSFYTFAKAAKEVREYLETL